MAIGPRRGDAWVEDVSMQMDHMDSMAIGSQEAHPSILGRQRINVSLVIEPHPSMDMNPVMEALHASRGPELLRALAVALEGGVENLVEECKTKHPKSKPLGKNKTRAMQV